MINPINSELRPRVNGLVAEEWAGPLLVTAGMIRDTSGADGFVSISDGELTGYVLYRMDGGQCEILILQSLQENRGIGSALIRAVIDKAESEGCARVWLVTTNDNLHAIRFYQKFGFELNAVRINALDEARKQKPSIPLLGNEGIPIKHEFEFEYKLGTD